MRIKLIIIALVFLLGASRAGARPEIMISPRKIVPGGIMVVTVKNAPEGVEGSFNGRQLHFNPAKGSYKAAAGIDLNAEPGVYPLSVTAAGKTLTRTIKIAKKAYPVQRLTLPEDKVVLSPENEARVEREQKALSAIWPVESIRIWNGRFIDPLPGKEITTPFGVRRIINKIPKNSHSGIDLAAETGEAVRAPNDGVVVLVDDQFFSGNSLIVDHGQGIYSMFFHLSKISVRPGQAVTKGDVIGLVGATGRVTGSCLHWGVRMQGAKVDPLQLIKLKLD